MIKQGLQKRMSPESYDRLMAVLRAGSRPGAEVSPEPRIETEAQMVDARPLKKMIDALIDHGWLMYELAEGMGVGSAVLTRIRSGRKTMCRRVIAERVTRFYEAHKGELGISGKHSSAYEPAYETACLLWDLSLNQWSLPAVAAEVGASREALSLIRRHPDTRMVSSSIAAAVRMFYVTHDGMLGPSPESAAQARGRLPAWRTDPVMISGLFRWKELPEPRLIRKEFELEQTICVWLSDQRFSHAWLELPAQTQLFLAQRFDLEVVGDRSGVMSVLAFSSRTRANPARVRKLTRTALALLLKDQRVQTSGYDQELRLYMTHAGLRGL
jgi:hypothetical protein